MCATLDLVLGAQDIAVKNADVVPAFMGLIV